MDEPGRKVTAEQAIAEVASLYGDLPDGHRFSAQRAERTALWSIVGVDEEDMPYAGGLHLVGPDRRVWAVASGGHDSALAAAAIQGLYDAEVADRVDDNCFDEWLSVETQRRRAAIPDLIAGAISGSLRTRRGQLP